MLFAVLALISFCSCGVMCSRVLVGLVCDCTRVTSGLMASMVCQMSMSSPVFLVMIVYGRLWSMLWLMLRLIIWGVRVLCTGWVVVSVPLCRVAVMVWGAVSLLVVCLRSAVMVSPLVWVTLYRDFSLLFCRMKASPTVRVWGARGDSHSVFLLVVGGGLVVGTA